MGAPKALLEMEGRTFVDRAVGAMRDGGCDEVVVVTGPADREETPRVRAAAEAAGARVVSNPSAESEQIDSLHRALAALDPDAEAMLVTPVDYPALTPAVVSALIAGFRRAPAPVARPTHAGGHGHPVLFAREVFPELLRGDLPEGARSVVHAHAARMLEVEVDEPGVLVDVDTPADYRRLREAGAP